MTDGLERCWWSGAAGDTPDPRMVAYHDDEWGVPCHDDVELFERLALESFQAGLSWSSLIVGSAIAQPISPLCMLAITRAAYSELARRCSGGCVEAHGVPNLGCSNGKCVSPRARM